MTATETAWLAGLLEGEGWFGVWYDQRSDAKRRPGIGVGVKMCDRDVVNRAARLMNGNVYRRTSASLGKNARKDQFVVRVYGAKAEYIMRMLLPHMGARRTERINQCLSVPNLSHHMREAEA